jgi:hypothetical protein
LRQDALANETEFLEDFLVAIYNDVFQWQSCDNDGTRRDHKQYEEARFKRSEGTRLQLRILLIRNALYKLLRTLKEESRIFLIIDGFECCSASLRLLLDAELYRLLQCRVSVMVTSRIAIYERRKTMCDHRDHGETLEDDTIDQGSISDDNDVPSKERGESVEKEPSEICDLSGDEHSSRDEDSTDFGEREFLDIFLKCKACKRILCFDCHSRGRTCGRW